MFSLKCAGDASFMGIRFVPAILTPPLAPRLSDIGVLLCVSQRNVVIRTTVRHRVVPKDVVVLLAKLHY